MKKPDRKAFQREYGPRGPAKYATALRKYRKFLKNQPKPKAATPKTEPKTAPKPKPKPKPAPKPSETKGVGPVKSGAEYARSLTKGKSASSSKEDLQINNQSKKRNLSLQANKGTGRDGSFGEGTYGRGYPDDKRKKLLKRNLF